MEFINLQSWCSGKLDFVPFPLSIHVLLEVVKAYIYFTCPHAHLAKLSAKVPETNT